MTPTVTAISSHFLRFGQAGLRSGLTSITTLERATSAAITRGKAFGPRGS